MPNASVAAAAPGLPTEPATDFHLAIGRQLAVLQAEIDRTEAEESAMKSCGHHGANYMASAGAHLMDRDDILIRSLSTFPAASLAGAAVQVAAAVNLYKFTRSFEGEHPEEVRAIERMLHSALRVMVEQAGLDRARDGISRLATPYLDTWRDPREIIAEVFPQVPAEGQADAS